MPKLETRTEIRQTVLRLLDPVVAWAIGDCWGEDAKPVLRAAGLLREDDETLNRTGYWLLDMLREEAQQDGQPRKAPSQQDTEPPPSAERAIEAMRKKAEARGDR